MFRTCSRCKKSLPVEMFCKSKQHASGFYPYCGPCRVQYAREWREKNPVAARKAKNRKRLAEKAKRERLGLSYGDVARLRRYGVDADHYARLVEGQAGKCAICGGEQQARGRRALKFDVDHCHRTNQVRGLLCGNCNRGLGSFCDDVKRLRAAIDYLRRHRAQLPR